MALKHLMEMTKADRYTADGCEALNKAREADVEDRTYKTGEISEKTGLQKQPDGSWAPPKGSSAAKHQKAMEGAKKTGIVNKVPAGWKKAEGVTTTPNGYVAITNGGSLFPKEGQAKREVKFIKQEDFEKGNAGKPKSNVPGNIPLNNEYYKDDVRTEAGARKILSETKTEAIQSRIKDLETLKEKNGGKLGPQGEKELQMNKEELAKRSGSAGSKMTNEQRKKWEDKAANSSETKASLRNFINSMERDESFKKANPHAEEIIDIYKKELAKREGNENYRPEKVYEEPKKEIKTNGLTPAEKFNSQETAKTINAATNDTKQRDKMLTEKANKEFGTKGNNPVEVAGELLINIRKAKPHSDEWYIAMDKYDTFSDTYRSTNGSDALDYYNSQFDKLLMTPNWNKEKLTDGAPRELTGDTKIRVRK